MIGAVAVVHDLVQVNGVGSVFIRLEALMAIGPGKIRSILISRAFRFRNIDEAIGGAHALNDAFKGTSTLFRAGKANSYLLVVHQPATQTPEEFNKVCNILSEYGASESCTPSSEAYLREHSEIVIGEDAVRKLASVIRDKS